MAVDYSTLKKGGFMRQKQKNCFSLRLAVVGGNLTAENLKTIAEVADKYGDGHVHLTSRQSVEIPFIKLDDIDVSILKIINEDVRTSYRQISRSLDVSVGTVHNRIDKMVKSGVIKKFSPVIDHEILGYVLTTIIGVRVKGGKLKNWEEKTYFNKNVVGIYDVTGEYDAFLIAKFKDTNELNTFIKDLVKDPNIERTYTQTVLDVIKEDMGSSNIL